MTGQRSKAAGGGKTCMLELRPSGDSSERGHQWQPAPESATEARGTHHQWRSGQDLRGVCTCGVQERQGDCNSNDKPVTKASSNESQADYKSAQRFMRF